MQRYVARFSGRGFALEDVFDRGLHSRMFLDRTVAGVEASKSSEHSCLGRVYG